VCARVCVCVCTHACVCLCPCVPALRVCFYITVICADTCPSKHLRECSTVRPHSHLVFLEIAREIDSLWAVARLPWFSVMKTPRFGCSSMGHGDVVCGGVDSSSSSGCNSSSSSSSSSTTGGSMESPADGMELGDDVAPLIVAVGIAETGVGQSDV
jgi:hypothetical protein